MPVTINGSTGISGVDGSAGTPALIGSDADTGIFVAAGQVSASINGTAGNVPLVSGTAQNSTSGTSIDFTGIPSWVKRVTVMFNGVSTNGASPIQVQLGTSSGPTTSGYVGSVQGPFDNSVGAASHSSGFRLSNPNQASNVHHGIMTIVSMTGNVWAEGSLISWSSSIGAGYGSGSVSLSATLDRVRITTVNGTDTFDAGSINIMYE